MPFMPGQLDVHQHQVGLALGASLTPSSPVHRLERRVALDLQHVARRASCSSRCLRRSGSRLIDFVLGMVKVKVEPLPGSLSSQIGRRAARRTFWSARGRGRCLPACSCSRGRPGGTPRTPPPGPPARCRCRCRAPRPTDVAASRRACTSTRPPSGVNLTALVSRLSRICLNLRSSATISPSSGSTCCAERDAVALRALAHQRHRVGERRRRGRRSTSSSSMRPASTFDRSRMSLMSDEQVLARRVDVLEVVVLLLVQLAEHALEQHLGEADDRVQRRAQLVRHVGEELGLVLVGDLELAALVLDLVEQPRVLDRDHRLVGEGLEQRDVLVGERADLIAADARSRRSPLPSHSIGSDEHGLRCRAAPATARARRHVRVVARRRDNAAPARRAIALPVPLSPVDSGADRQPARAAPASAPWLGRQTDVRRRRRRG